MLGLQGACGQDVCIPYSNIVTGGYSINTSMHIKFKSTKLTDIHMYASKGDNYLGNVDIVTIRKTKNNTLTTSL